MSNQIDDVNYALLQQFAEERGIRVISRFSGPTRFLSNFYAVPHRIRIDDHEVPTVEHGYQMAKTSKDHWKTLMSFTARACGEMKRAAKSMKQHPRWTPEVAMNTMRSLLRQKFRRGTVLARKLVSTGNTLIIEGNYWHDNYWGDCSCDRCAKTEGMNHMGRLLMEIRNELKSVPEPNPGTPIERWSMEDLRNKAKEIGLSPIPRRKADLIRMIKVHSPRIDFHSESTRPIWYERVLDINPRTFVDQSEASWFGAFDEVCAIMDKDDAAWREYHTRKLAQMSDSDNSLVRSIVDMLLNDQKIEIEDRVDIEALNRLQQWGIGYASTKDACIEIARNFFNSGQVKHGASIAFNNNHDCFVCYIDKELPAHCDLIAYMKKIKEAPGYYTDLSMAPHSEIKPFSIEWIDPMTNSYRETIVWADSPQSACNRFRDIVAGVKVDAGDFVQLESEFVSAKIYDTDIEAEAAMAVMNEGLLYVPDYIL